MARCKLANCTIATDGRCLEGQKNDCPNLLLNEPSDKTGVPLSATGEGSEASASPYPPSEDLYSGLPLEIAEAREFCRRARAIVVVFAGMPDSGKTSLLARWHQQFQIGPLGGYDFAGSRTLPRFEELNWKSSVESGVGSPTMDRSSRKYDNTFLHFTVRQRVNGAELVDILLNDISGDTFREAIAAESLFEQLICLRRADHLALVVDGAAIAQRELRYDHCAKARNFVQRVLQTGQVGKQTVLHLIIAKLDELLKEELRAENLDAATKLETDFAAQFSSRVAKVHYWRLAARPLDGTMPTQEIIADLFATCVGSTYRYQNAVALEVGATRLARDFCRFGEQTVPLP